jgi:hypothetical protein
MNEFRERVLELSEADFEGPPRNDALPLDVMQEFVVRPSPHSHVWWIDHKGRTPPEMLNGLFQQLALRGGTPSRASVERCASSGGSASPL